MIIIYTNETCPYCKQVKEELNKNGFSYEERLGSKFKKELQQVYNTTGMPTVPTIKYDGEYFVPGRDFANQVHLINLLKNYKRPTYSDSYITLQKIKTLNYNINIAFSRLDQLLRQIETKLNKEDEQE
tara:strand:+ start:146 stop:529 length:384 start_codon:yes stop_codon:yes gene_type:complete